MAEKVRLRFNERRATEAAARLLKLRGGQMSYMKLIKLLYLADREALLRWGRPITTDRYVSMDKGPVVSRIYSLITEEIPPGEESFWRRHISAPEANYEVRLLSEPKPWELSRAEEALLDEVFQKYGALDRWKVVEITHDLPEWQDPNGSSVPIEYGDILRAGGKTDEEIAEIEAELAALEAAEHFLDAR